MASSRMSRSLSPGWRPDPYDQTQYRWWDGAQWTGATYPVDGPRRRSLLRTVGAVIFTVFAVIATMAFIAQFGSSAQRAGHSFNPIPAVMAVGWACAAYRCWNPKR